MRWRFFNQRQNQEISEFYFSSKNKLLCLYKVYCKMVQLSCSKYFWERIISANTTLLVFVTHYAEVSLLSPLLTPRVLNNPEVKSIFGSVTDCQDTMIKMLFTLCIIENSTSIKSDTLAIYGNGNGSNVSWKISKFEQTLIDLDNAMKCFRSPFLGNLIFKISQEHDTQLLISTN